MQVFISKNRDEAQVLAEYCEKKGWQLHAQALIEIAYNPHFSSLHSCDAIFFGSQNAVEHYCDNFILPTNIRIACVGPSTATALIKRGFQPAFVGVKSGDIDEVARNFSLFLNGKKCFFPVSDKSLGTMQLHLKPNQIESSVLYTTTQVSTQLPSCDLYIFTSPSNVHSFYIQNQMPKNAQCIAWGKSTAAELIARDILPVHTLKEAQYAELLSVLNNM